MIPAMTAHASSAGDSGSGSGCGGGPCFADRRSGRSAAADPPPGCHPPARLAHPPAAPAAGAHRRKRSGAARGADPGSRQAALRRLGERARNPAQRGAAHAQEPQELAAAAAGERTDGGAAEPRPHPRRTARGGADHRAVELPDSARAGAAHRRAGGGQLRGRKTERSDAGVVRGDRSAAAQVPRS